MKEKRELSDNMLSEKAKKKEEGRKQYNTADIFRTDIEVLFCIWNLKINDRKKRRHFIKREQWWSAWYMISSQQSLSL